MFTIRDPAKACAARRPLVLAIAAAFWASAAVALACVEGDVRGEAVSVEREVGGTPAGEKAAVQILGAGWFSAAEIVKHGGSDDNTSVTIEIDGEPMITTSFATLKKSWMQLQTAYIVARVTEVGETSTMTIWYRPELKFRAVLAVRVDVQEDGVDGLRVRTVMNKPAPHEHIAGPQGTLSASAFPAFR